MNTITFPRGSEARLTEHFASREFDCHCGCEKTTVAVDLPAKLEILRRIACKPIPILSGFRCEKRQNELRERGLETAVGKSQHELGAAADIYCGDLSGNELAALARQAGFRAVGVSESWIHVDLRDDRDRSWTYRPSGQEPKA